MQILGGGMHCNSGKREVGCRCIGKSVGEHARLQGVVREGGLQEWMVMREGGCRSGGW